MRPDSLASGFFETPARTERLQLLAYLLRNAAQPVYLRGPSGAGKTSAGALVAQAMDDVAGVIWLKAERAGELRSVFAGELARAGLPAEPWPAVLEQGPDARDWLLVVDDVDRLDPVAGQELARLPLSRVRLLLLGEGGLDGAIPGPVQFLDLPPLNRAQAARFLRLRAGPEAGRVTDDLAAGLYRATDGQPGALLAALDEVLRQEAAVVSGPPPGRLRRHLAWGAGAVLALALAVVLVFQETINAWFLGEPASPPLRAEAPASANPAEIRREASDVAPPVPPGPISQPAAGPDGANPDRSPAITAAQAGAVTGDAEADPLDAVLRDALAAMDAARPAGVPTASATTAPAPLPDMPTTPPQTSDGVSGLAGPGERDAVPARREQQRPPAVGEPGARPVPAQAQQRRQEQPAPAAALDPAASAPVSASGQGAEVIDRSARAARDPVVAEPRSPGATSGAAEVRAAGPRPLAGDWLESRSPERYTLQLVAARDRDAVQRFVARHGIKAPYAIFERRLDGRPWYALVAGDFADRAAALRARDALPTGIRAADVWPRTFGSIRELQRTP